MEMRNWQKSDLPGQVLGGIENSSESHKGNGPSPVVKVIRPKYYKHLKKGAHQSHLDRKNELVSDRLDCASSKTEILNKIGI